MMRKVSRHLKVHAIQRMYHKVTHLSFFWAANTIITSNKTKKQSLYWLSPTLTSFITHEILILLIFEFHLERFLLALTTFFPKRTDNPKSLN